MCVFMAAELPDDYSFIVNAIREALTTWAALVRKSRKILHSVFLCPEKCM